MDETPGGDLDRSGRWRPPGWTPGRAMPIAAGVAAGLLAAQAAVAVFAQLRGVLTIVVVSLFLSFALEPGVQSLARRGMRRGVATGLVFLALVVLLGGFVTVMAGLLVDQIRTLAASGPQLLAGLADQAGRLPGELGELVAGWLDEQRRLLPGALQAQTGLIGRGAVGLGQTLLGGLFQLATIALVTFYLVADGPRLRFKLASRLPRDQQLRVLGVWELAIAKTGGYVYSRLLTAIISAGFHVTVFTVIDLPYAIALGVWVGVISSLIPAVGTYLAAVLPLAVALATSPPTAVWVLVAIVVYQQIENYLVVPRITAQTLNLHPALAFLSVIVGAALAGASGALLAIPAVAIAAGLLAAAGAEHEVLEHHLVATGPRAARDLLRSLDDAEPTVEPVRERSADATPEDEDRSERTI